MIESNLSMVTLTSCKLTSFLLALSLASQFPAFGRQASASGQMKRQQAERAADHFIKRFRETLDFGVAFNEMAVSDATRRLRAAGEFTSLDLSESLADEIDDATAARLYQAFMNFVYLRAVYAASIKAGFADADRAPLPREIRKAIERSSHLKIILNEGAVTAPEITSVEELRRYMADLENIVRLFRKYMPRKVFSSRAYRANVKVLERERGHQFEVQQGDHYFGIRDDIQVYAVCRDIFCFKFIEDNDKFRVLYIVL